MNLHFVLLGTALLFSQAVVSDYTPLPAHTLKSDESEAGKEGALTPEQAKKAIAKEAQAAVIALKNKDAQALQRLAHPKKGIRFTPYATVDLKHNVVLDPSRIAKGFEDTTVYEWGVYDGTGDPIRMTFADYWKRFIYDRDFAKPEKIGFNEPVKQGNSINNIREAYPNGVYVEYHFTKDEEGNEMGWRSLRLVFEKEKGAWHLVGVVHDEWTT